jgi:hypothetical protein
MATAAEFVALPQEQRVDPTTHALQLEIVAIRMKKITFFDVIQLESRQWSIFR